MVLSACTVFGNRDGTEETPYEVIDQIAEDFEVREYAPRVAAQVVMRPEGEDGDRGNDAFRLLFRYIQGANAGSQEVAMTVPVETVEPSQKIAMTVPVQSDKEREDGTLMRFFLPSRFTAETAPKPTDDRIQIVPVEGQTLAVLRFTGLGWDSTVRDKKKALMRSLRSTDWVPQAEPFAFFYDPPWTLPFFRRNEVAVPVSKPGEG